MNKRILMIISMAMLPLTGLGQASTGSVFGKVFGPDSLETIPSTKVWIETPGGPIGAITDKDGRYKISGIVPGKYVAYAKASGYEKRGYEVEVHPEGTHKLDLVMKDNVLGVIDVVAGGNKIDSDLISFRIPTEDIKRSPFVRSPLDLVVATCSDIQRGAGNELIIRGSRPGDVVYIVDGVKVRNMSAIPGAAMKGIQAYTGGVPAKYGDTMGGVIILESMGYFDLYYAWKARQ